MYQQLVMSGTLPNGYAADDGAALVFDGPDLREVVSWRPGATGYRVERTSDGAVIEEALAARTIG